MSSSGSEVTYPINDPNDPVLRSLRENLIQENARSNESQNYFVFPIIGRIRFLRDKNGILLLMSIVAYWVYGMWSSYYVIIQPHYQDGRIHPVVLYCK